MKAIQILEWIVKESIEGGFLNFVDVPEEGENEWQQNEDWWKVFCGSCPPHPIQSGRYLYYYQSAICDDMYIGGRYYEPDSQIEIPDEYGFDYIYLYKIEE